jgi:hypothetical protein
VELFVMDVGWYLGAGETSDFDFDSGLGRGRPIPTVFLRAASLVDCARRRHEVRPGGTRTVSRHGRKTGLAWNRPTRMATTTDRRSMRRFPAGRPDANG